MSTPALIAQRLSSGVYRCITVHWDGHPDTAGQTLVKFYLSEERVNDLLALGDLSELYPSLDATVAFHRDKGEDLESNAPGYFATLEDLESWREEFGGQYLYIWEGGAWQYRGVPLADVLAKAGVDAAPVPEEPDWHVLGPKLADDVRSIEGLLYEAHSDIPDGMRAKRDVFAALEIARRILAAIPGKEVAK